MWKVEKACDENDVPLEKNRRHFFLRKHREAVELLDSRLQQLIDSLNAGLPLRNALSRGWVHPEAGGVFAICANTPPLRMYFLPLPGVRLILTFTIGDKNRQSSDVKEVAEWAKSILDDLQGS